MAHKNIIPASTRIWRVFLTAAIMTVISVSQAFGQQNRIDSFEALLPQKQGEERVDALRTLGRLTQDGQIRKHYVNMLLDEARRQKNANDEGRALSILTEIYFSQFDTDSVFVFGEEAIRFTRRHKQYNFLTAPPRFLTRGSRIKKAFFDIVVYTIFSFQKQKTDY